MTTLMANVQYGRLVFMITFRSGERHFIPFLECPRSRAMIHGQTNRFRLRNAAPPPPVRSHAVSTTHAVVRQTLPCDQTCLWTRWWCLRVKQPNTDTKQHNRTQNSKQKCPLIQLTFAVPRVQPRVCVCSPPLTELYSTSPGQLQRCAARSSHTQRLSFHAWPRI